MAQVYSEFGSLIKNEKPFPVPSWRTNANPEKLSDAPAKFKASPEAIERVKAQLAFRGVRV